MNRCCCAKIVRCAQHATRFRTNSEMRGCPRKYQPTPLQDDAFLCICSVTSACDLALVAARPGTEKVSCRREIHRFAAVLDEGLRSRSDPPEPRRIQFHEFCVGLPHRTPFSRQCTFRCASKDAEIRLPRTLSVSILTFP